MRNSGAGTPAARKVDGCKRPLIHQRDERRPARHPSGEPVLRLNFSIEAGGLADGASALFLVSGSVHAESGQSLSLGAAAPVLRQLGYSNWGDGTSPVTAQVLAEWTLSDTAIERIEKIRDGGGLTIHLKSSTPCSAPAPPCRTGPSPTSRSGSPGPGQLTCARVDAHQ